ncbi:hypothetical protein VitviT2T_004347 [Vitis vinifera]|uniref:Uncharacterized protein n=1 Tax=Vitis vinifera TaxID=29760 RepID=A0ABY9BPJ7_VITVI|nr:hypothetical protein VitviT2T_004347 [Vitis vinifera]
MAQHLRTSSSSRRNTDPGSFVDNLSSSPPTTSASQWTHDISRKYQHLLDRSTLLSYDCVLLTQSDLMATDTQKLL